MTGTDMPCGVTLAKRESRTIPVDGLDLEVRRTSRDRRATPSAHSEEETA